MVGSEQSRLRVESRPDAVKNEKGKERKKKKKILLKLFKTFQTILDKKKRLKNEWDNIYLRI